MADQVGSGTVPSVTDESVGREPGMSDVAPIEALVNSDKHVAHHGRPVSWVAVTIIIIGFAVGGIALVAGPVWWLFWTGAGIAAVGSILALASGIFTDWY